MLIECRRCDGRGFVTRLNAVVRGYYRTMVVVELAQARLYTYKERCPHCIGYGRTLPDGGRVGRK